MNSALAAVSREVRENVEPGNIVIASSDIQQHLDYIGLWRLADDSFFQDRMQMPNFSRNRNVSKAQHPYMQKLIEKRKIMNRYSGSNESELSDILLNDLDSWAQPCLKVYWIGNFEDMKDMVPSSDSLHTAAKIELPKIDIGELGMGAQFPGMQGGPMQDDRFSRRERFRSMAGGLMPGGRFQRGMMRYLQSGQELLLVEWKRSLNN